MKNSGIEWIGEIPEDWEVSKIGQLYEERRTKVSDTVYPPLSVTMQGILPQLENAAKSDAHDDRKLVLKGDFAINSRSDRRGSCGISNFDGSVSLINTVLHPKTEMNPIYYNWLFHSFRFSDEYYKNGHGIVDDLWTTSWSEMKKIFIPLPPKETQQRIASYLDKKCSKIEETIQNQQQVIEKLKDYKQSLITEAVTGKIKIQNGKVCGKYESYKDSKLKWLGDFKIPEKWSNIQVKSFVSIPVVDGPHESPELFDNGIPYISATAIENSKIDFSLKRGFISEKYCNECDKRYKPMRDDILMIKLGATTGQVAIVETDERFNIWVPLAAIRCNKNIALPKFVFYSFQSDYCLKQMEMSWTFGTQQTLGVSSIERLKIFLPNIETQKNITHFLDKKCTAIDTAIEQKQKLIEKLTEYKKSLIYECVTGKKVI